ncbi:MAG: class I SAM-dependent methyltransferase [Litorimonas sp.]
MSGLADAKAAMADIYERNAAWWDARRDLSMYEAPWLNRMMDGLPPRPRILDLGCGTGQPIARYLMDAGATVVGVDASSAMIQTAKRNVPDGTWHVADMRSLPELGPFDAIVSWDAFFHLSPHEQRAGFPELCARIRPGGAFLATIGPSEGECEGWINGERVYHGSLSEGEYRRRLGASGFEDIQYSPEAPDMRGRSLLLARGKSASAA